MQIMTPRHWIPLLVVAALLLSSGTLAGQRQTMEKPLNPYYSRTDIHKLNLPDAVWKKVLSPEVYAVARKKGTEEAFSGKFWDYTGKGTYYCTVPFRRKVCQHLRLAKFFRSGA